MFGIVRLFIGLLFLAAMFFLVKKSNALNKKIMYVISIIISIVIITLSSFIPFENVFITFSKPESAYNYINFDRSNVQLVLDGDKTSFVVGENNDSDNYLIVPKSDNGWKLGLGLDTRRVLSKIANGIAVNVYQYKNTDDFFITILNTNEGESEIVDSNYSDFISNAKYNDELDKEFVTYYAYINQFNEQYHIMVDGIEVL